MFQHKPKRKEDVREDFRITPSFIMTKSVRMYREPSVVIFETLRHRGFKHLHRDAIEDVISTSALIPHI